MKNYFLSARTSNNPSQLNLYNHPVYSCTANLRKTYYQCGPHLSVWATLIIEFRISVPHWYEILLSVRLSLFAHKRPSPFFYTHPTKTPLLSDKLSIYCRWYMLSTAESANVRFLQVVQLFSPPPNPANAPRAQNSFYKFGKKIILGVNNVRTNIRVQ